MTEPEVIQLVMGNKQLFSIIVLIILAPHIKMPIAGLIGLVLTIWSFFI